MNRYRTITVALIIAAVLVTGCGQGPLDDNTGGDDSQFAVYLTGNGLADNWVTDIAVDTIRGGVWLTTKNGLSFYSNADSSLTTYGADAAIPDMEMTSVTVDVTGSVWISTVTGAAFLASDDSLFQYLPDSENLVHRYVTDTVYTMVDNGSRWFGTRGGISVRRFSGWSSYTTALGPSYDITSLAVGPGNTVWAGSTDGLAVWNGTEWDLTLATDLPSTYINTVYRDWRGGMWVGTGSIATYWDGSVWTNFGAADGLPATGVTAFVRDTDGVLWAGTNSGVYFQGVYTWNAFALPQSAGAAVTALAWDITTRSLWIGTNNGAVQYITAAVSD